MSRWKPLQVKPAYWVPAQAVDATGAILNSNPVTPLETKSVLNDDRVSRLTAAGVAAEASVPMSAKTGKTERFILPS